MYYTVNENLFSKKFFDNFFCSADIHIHTKIPDYLQ